MTVVQSTVPIVRTVRFEYPDDFDPEWHPLLPEFAAVANAVSLMMPHVEPYIARSVRGVIDDLPESLAAEAEGYAGQEFQHNVVHRRFNKLVIANTPAVARPVCWLGAIIGWLERTRSVSFHLAFASGFETIAYAGARWVDARTRRLLDGSDSLGATLFLWHLAEEIEHKNVAFDVYQQQTETQSGIRRRSVQAAGLVVAAVLLALFCIINGMTLLWSNRRIWNPLAHLRLAGWSIGFAFELLPAMAVSLFAGHHPSSLVDPSWMAAWLGTYDPETREIPLWDDLGAVGLTAPANT